MNTKWTWRFCAAGLVVAISCGLASAATEQLKQAAITKGLEWLAANQSVSGAEGYWPYNNDGTVAATASAAMTFIEKGYMPGADVIIGATNYGDVVGRALNYVFNRAKADTYGIYFDAANFKRDVYTCGIAGPMVYALGQKLGPDTVIGRGSAVVSGLTYRQLMQNTMDWFGWGQNPDGGWRYTPNYGGSDNSTAQWGALQILYAQAWGLTVRDPSNAGWDVKAHLNSWVNTIQHPQDATWKAGGSGYTNNNEYVNMSKTGGMLLELAAMGVPISDPRVQNALNYMTSMITFDHWNQGASSFPDQWDGGNFNNPYAMWAVYKALSVYGLIGPYGPNPGEDFLIGFGISTAPGGFTIGQDVDPKTSLPGDWYSQYCDYLVSIQNGNGSWNGWEYWYGALATSWYINILNAVAPPPPGEIPEPVTMLSVLVGIAGLGGYFRRRRTA